jgi:hypothetical protein
MNVPAETIMKEFKTCSRAVVFAMKRIFVSRNGKLGFFKSQQARFPYSCNLFSGSTLLSLGFVRTINHENILIFPKWEAGSPEEDLTCVMRLRFW